MVFVFCISSDDSFTKIVEPMSEIREGSSNFTRMYIDIARGMNIYSLSKLYTHFLDFIWSLQLETRWLLKIKLF